MEEGPSKTYPAPDLENLEDVIKHDKLMREVYRKELGKDFESLKDGVCTGYVQGELDV